jgi:hypothetical protein
MRDFLGRTSAESNVAWHSMTDYAYEYRASRPSEVMGATGVDVGNRYYPATTIRQLDNARSALQLIACTAFAGYPKWVSPRPVCLPAFAEHPDQRKDGGWSSE